jgi:RNA polymerase sigma-70 factor (ECF subfamily)
VAESATDHLEHQLRQLWDQQRFEAVATLALEHYGQPILGLQIKMLRDPVTGSEAFSMFCEDLWKGLPRFQWRSSLRTWAFTLARNAAYRWQDDSGRRPDRNVSLERTPQLLEVVERVRTRTLAYLRTEAVDDVSALRATLTPADQMLLTLRLEQRLSWKEIAPITLGDADADAADVKREAARLRKRFQLVKEQLRKLARERGLLDHDRP